MELENLSFKELLALKKHYKQESKGCYGYDPVNHGNVLRPIDMPRYEFCQNKIQEITEAIDMKLAHPKGGFPSGFVA